MDICFSSTSVTSPAANRPSTVVDWSLFTWTSPKLFSLSNPFKGPVFGARPISRNTPSTFKSNRSFPSTDSSRTPVSLSFPKKPRTTIGVWKVTFLARRASCTNTSSALNSFLRWIRWISEAKFSRSRTAVKAELPPPTTATLLSR